MGNHSPNRRSVKRPLSPLVLIAALGAFTSSAAFAKQAAPTLQGVERNLTVNTILVRTGLKPCANDEAMENLAGGQLEELFHKQIESLNAKAYTQAAVKRLVKSECMKSCTCSARLKIVEAAPEKARNELSTDPLEKALAKMTDDDYAACRKPMKEICKRPEVKAFLKQIKAEMN